MFGLLRKKRKSSFARGLEGITVASTEIGGVREKEGFYHYRQYDAVELNEKHSLEDIWFLFFEGHLPSPVEKEAFNEEIKKYQKIPEKVSKIIEEIAKNLPKEHLFPAFRSVISYLALSGGYRSWLDVDAKTFRSNAMEICVLTPILLMTIYRISKGLDPIAPRENYSYAQNYLYMLAGKEPEQKKIWAVERYLISTIDHGFNASTFTARVITSTGADIGAAIVGAIGSLSGPLHGGAPSRALDMLDAIGEPSNAANWVKNSVKTGDRIMGFGHRVYKIEDPRSRLLKKVARKIGGKRVQQAVDVERTAIKTLHDIKPGRGLYTNVEFFAGVVMEACGIPKEMFTPTFMSSRVIGWCSHSIEQAANNRIFRPRSLYTGEKPPKPVS